MGRRSSDDKKLGVAAAAELLNHLDEATRSRILKEMQGRDPELTAKVQSQMFVFEDLIHLEAQELQKLLREIPQIKLALALRRATEELKAHIFSNLSSRSAQALKDEIDALGPRRVTDVESAQKDIVETAKRLRAGR